MFATTWKDLMPRKKSLEEVFDTFKVDVLKVLKETQEAQEGQAICPTQLAVRPMGFDEVLVKSKAALTFNESRQILRNPPVIRKYTRRGWTAKGMWIRLIEGLRNEKPHFIMKTSSGDFAVWFPSVCDLLAEDWEEVKQPGALKVKKPCTIFIKECDLRHLGGLEDTTLYGQLHKAGFISVKAVRTLGTQYGYEYKLKDTPENLIVPFKVVNADECS